MTDEFIRSDLPRYGRTPRELLRDPERSHLAVRLYAVLDDYAGVDGKAFPKRATLASSCGCSVDTIDRAIAELEESGWLLKEARARDDGGQSSSLYTLAGSVHTPAALMRPPRRTGAAPPAALVRPLEGEPLKERNTITPAEPGTRPKVVDDNDPHWERFWSLYPRKLSKGQARKAWATAVTKVDSPAVLVRAVERFAGQSHDVKFIPYPATWLNAERWLDDDLRLNLPPTPGRRNVRSTSEECPIHAGQHLGRCSGCRADELAVDRPPARTQIR